MFRQAHIILARYIADEMQSEELSKHKLSLYIGSVIPDMTIKYRLKDHEFDQTWEDEKERIRAIVESEPENAHEERVLCRQIGIVLHFLADYFTCPHNPSYGINIVEHGIYEGFQALELRNFLYTTEAMEQFFARKKSAEKIHSTEELFSYIEWMHDRYLSESSHTPKGDCRWVLNVCAVTALVLASD